MSILFLGSDSNAPLAPTLVYYSFQNNKVANIRVNVWRARALFTPSAILSTRSAFYPVIGREGFNGGLTSREKIQRTNTFMYELDIR
jgi:hypothetical protein